MELKDRTILITGGSTGIGLELATQLLRKGNRIIVTGRDQSKLDDIKAKLSGVHTFKSDVSNYSDMLSLHSQILSTFPDLSVLINNAGIMRNVDLNAETDLNDLVREIEINLSAPIKMIQLYMPHLKSQKSSLIVNVSSGLAFVPFPLSPIYSAAKAGVHAYTRVLRLQMQKSNVEIIELMPPGTETELFRGEFQEETKNMKAMPVTELVKRAIIGIEKGLVEIRPGQSNQLKILSRIAPEFILGQMAKTLIKKDRA